MDKAKVKDAIAKINSHSISIRKATKSIGIQEWTIRDHIKQGWQPLHSQI